MKIFKFCLKYLLSHKLSVTMYLVFTLCVAITNIMSPLIVAGFLDNLIANGTVNVIIRICISFVIVNAFSILIGYMNTITYARLQTDMAYQLNRDIIHHIQNLSLSYSSQTDTAYLVQRINSDSNELITFCMSVMQNIIGNIVILVIPFIIMMTINLIISLFLIGFFILYVIMYILSRNLLYRTNFILKEQRDTFFSKFHDQLKYINLIKLNGIDFTDKLQRAFKGLLGAFIKGQKANYLVYGLDNMIKILAQVMLFIIGGIQILEGKFTIGMFTMFSSYFTMVLGSGSYFFNLGASYQTCLAAHNRLAHILSKKQESVGNDNLLDINTITLKNVNLKNKKNNRLSNMFSARFEKGNIYAIVGANGTGKSTIANLIMGMYIDEREGDIQYNNISINSLNMPDIRREQLAFAEQEPALLSDTIRYNITLSREANDAEDDRILEYAKILGIEKFVTEATLGSFFEEENVPTSGGEKQKIAILRVLYKDTPVMIFDEPTSALDSKSIKSFINYLGSIKKEKIIIIITHDEYVSKTCDRVVSVG